MGWYQGSEVTSALHFHCPCSYKAAEIVAHHNGVADAVADAVDDLTKPGVTHDTRAADIANSQTPDAVVKAVSVPSQDEATKVEVDAVVPEAGLSNSQITSGVSPGLADPKSISEAQVPSLS